MSESITTLCTSSSGSTALTPVHANVDPISGCHFVECECTERIFSARLSTAAQLVALIVREQKCCLLYSGQSGNEKI